MILVFQYTEFFLTSAVLAKIPIAGYWQRFDCG